MGRVDEPTTEDFLPPLRKRLAAIVDFAVVGLWIFRNRRQVHFSEWIMAMIIRHHLR